MTGAGLHNSIPAYEGDDPYVFISYARKDTARVMPFLERLKQKQYRFWYDQGIDPDARFWSAVIGEHLVNASFVLLFMSAYANASDNVFKEISLADEDKKPMIIVFLEETSLSPRWRLLLSGAQRMDYHKYAGLEQFLPKLFMSRQFGKVRGEGVDVPVPVNAQKTVPVPVAKPTRAPKTAVTRMPNPTGTPPLKPAARVGDKLLFGNYQREEIEWRVLAVEKDRALLISEKILDAKPYNTTDESVTWETSTLRKWLNSDFYYAAFTEAEWERIAETVVVNSDNPRWGTTGGNNTRDKVFLLSLGEAMNRSYFADNKDRIAFPTEYAKGQGAWTSDVNRAGWWRLRSPGYGSNYAANVFGNGDVFDFGYIVDYERGGVRPALWLNLESGIF